MKDSFLQNAKFQCISVFYQEAKVTKRNKYQFPSTGLLAKIPIFATMQSAGLSLIAKWEESPGNTEHHTS